MARYHLYSISGAMLIGSQTIEADGDNEAARIAERTGRGELVEIWDATSRVRIVRPGGARARGAQPARERLA
jgi:hypothetical protein